MLILFSVLSTNAIVAILLLFLCFFGRNRIKSMCIFAAGSTLLPVEISFVVSKSNIAANALCDCAPIRRIRRRGLMERMSECYFWQTSPGMPGCICQHPDIREDFLPITAYSVAMLGTFTLSFVCIVYANMALKIKVLWQKFPESCPKFSIKFFLVCIRCMEEIWLAFCRY